MNDARRYLLHLLPLALILALLAGGDASARAAAKVFVIDVHGTVWPGQAKFVIDKLDEAAQQGASAVILDVDSPGGLLASAFDVKKALLSHDRDYVTIGYVHNEAFSSASLITLSCKYIAMAPGATLGSAQPHPITGGEPDPETLSAVRRVFASTAEFRGRNPAIALAWVTSPSAIPSLGIKEGDILTLSTKQAKDNGYCDVVATDYPDILDFVKLSGARLEPQHLGFWLEVALFITQPWVTVLLLILGLAAVIAEMLTMHSWGIAGTIGGVVVGIVFLSYIAVGAATWIGVLLFIAGAALLLIEIQVFPTHGILGFIGLVCAIIGLFLALGGQQGNALVSTLVAVFFSVACVMTFFFYLPKSRIWKILGQPMQQRATSGYVSGGDFTSYLGHVGTALTVLRPSGTAEFEGNRVDVVTEGEFISQGTPIEVFQVQGSRVVVRPLPPDDRSGSGTDAPPSILGGTGILGTRDA